ncbi:hypothetical protein pb186bvf_006490 [Paramecium bursaria]
MRKGRNRSVPKSFSYSKNQFSINKFVARRKSCSCNNCGRLTNFQLSKDIPQKIQQQLQQKSKKTKTQIILVIITNATIVANYQHKCDGGNQDKNCKAKTGEAHIVQSLLIQFIFEELRTLIASLDKTQSKQESNEFRGENFKELQFIKIQYKMNQSSRRNASGSQGVRKQIRKYSRDSDYEQSSSESEQQQQALKKRVVKLWKPEEDQLLQELYIKYKGQWNQIAANIPDRNQSQCSQRWKRINPNRIKLRKQWTEEEDLQVVRLINKYGKNWKRIENEMQGRSGKQIRERFINKLDKSINHEPFNEREDQQICQLYLQHGPKWSEISKQLDGRPENMVKNRFYSHIKKQYNVVPSQKEEMSDDFQSDEYEYMGQNRLSTIQSVKEEFESFKNGLIPYKKGSVMQMEQGNSIESHKPLLYQPNFRMSNESVMDIPLPNDMFMPQGQFVFQQDEQPPQMFNQLSNQMSAMSLEHQQSHQ